MSRKPKKGYYVRGEFVAEGSELDLELKAELKGTTEASRTELKRESTELQKLGESLLTLRDGLLTPLALPEKLMDALAEAKRITNFEGKRRQMQFVGKLMRGLDDTTLDAVRAALQEQQSGSAAAAQALHEADGAHLGHQAGIEGDLVDTVGNFFAFPLGNRGDEGIEEAAGWR